VHTLQNANKALIVPGESVFTESPIFPEVIDERRFNLRTLPKTQKQVSSYPTTTKISHELSSTLEK